MIHNWWLIFFPLEIEQQASQLALPAPGQPGQLSLPSSTHPALIQTPTTTTHNLMSALALTGQQSRDLSNNNSHNQGRVSWTALPCRPWSSSGFKVCFQWILKTNNRWIKLLKQWWMRIIIIKVSIAWYPWIVREFQNCCQGHPSLSCFYP